MQVLLAPQVSSGGTSSLTHQAALDIHMTNGGSTCPVLGSELEQVRHGCTVIGCSAPRTHPRLSFGRLRTKGVWRRKRTSSASKATRRSRAGAVFRSCAGSHRPWSRVRHSNGSTKRSRHATPAWKSSRSNRSVARRLGASPGSRAHCSMSPLPDHPLSRSSRGRPAMR
jgi:hypothetical protein